MAEIPEPTKKQKADGIWEETAASRLGYPTIAEITKERMRRVIKLLAGSGKELDLHEASGRDFGFRVFKLAESNFVPWDADTPKDAKQLEAQLALHVDHIRHERTDLDILYEILLKDGYALTSSVEKIDVGKSSLFSIAKGALIVCLDRSLSLDLIKAIADKKPERVVCLDEGFAAQNKCGSDV